MDGPESDKFENFKSLINGGLTEIKKHIDELESFIMILAKGNFIFKLTCFRFKDAMFPQTRHFND